MRAPRPARWIDLVIRHVAGPLRLGGTLGVAVCAALVPAGPRAAEPQAKRVVLLSLDGGADWLVDRLMAEHRAGAERIGALAQALARYRDGGQAEFAPFANAVHAYANFHWDHMRLEEDRLLPLARTHLPAEDWKEIDAAFAGNVDPLLGAEPAAEFDALFRRIVALAPPPIGVGSARD
jgi:hypothetical protein